MGDWIVQSPAAKSTSLTFSVKTHIVRRKVKLGRGKGAQKGFAAEPLRTSQSDNGNAGV